MAGDLRVMAPVKAEHQGAICDLFCRTFGNYSEQRERGTERFLAEPYSYRHSRIGLIDERMVTHFGVVDYEMWVGRAKLRVAGVAGVATHVDFRKRGLMMQTGQACVDAMREAGFDFSLLFGIEDFYHRLGYTRAWSGTDFVATLGKLKADGGGLRLKKLPMEARAKLAPLHRKWCEGRTGEAVVPMGHRWNTGKLKETLYVWNRGGKAAGYIVARDQGARVDVLEGIGTGDDVLNAAVQLAKQFACDEIRFMGVSEKCELGRRLKRENIERQVRHRRNSGPLARVISLRSTLEKMSAELGWRLVQAGLGDYTGDFMIADGHGKVPLTIEGGHVQVCPRRISGRHRLSAGMEISQLVLGTDDPLEIAREAGMRLTGDARFLVPAMFPAQSPMLGVMDQF